MKPLGSERKSYRKILLLAVALAVASVLLYRSFFWIDRSRFSLGMGYGSWTSPDGFYSIRPWLYPTYDMSRLSVDEMYQMVERNPEGVYVIGTLRWDPEVREDGGVIVWNSENQKVFFYEKYNGTPYTVTWVDHTTVKVNDITLTLPHETYDYRHFWKTWKK